MTVEKIIEKTKEKDFKVYFKDPIDKLNKLNKQEKETKKEKKQIVREIAQRLETDGVTPIHSICQIMVKHLEGVVSPTFVRRCLSDKYKDEQRSKNAKKQNKTPKEPVTNGKDLATQVPLNSSAQDNKKEAIVIDITKNKISFPVDEADIESSLTQTSDIPVKDTTLGQPIDPRLPMVGQCTELDQTNALKQFKENNDNCPQCSIKDQINQELEESKKENDINFEFCITVGDLAEHLSIYILANNETEIWFNGRFDTQSKKIHSVSLGRLNHENGKIA